MYDSVDNDGGHRADGAQEASPSPRPMFKHLRREAIRRRRAPRWPNGDDDHHPPQPSASSKLSRVDRSQRLSRADNRAHSGEEWRGDTLTGDGYDRSPGFPDRIHDLSAQQVETQDEFGFMKPCWRLLERAGDDLDQVDSRVCSRFGVSRWVDARRRKLPRRMFLNGSFSAERSDWSSWYLH